jgi:ribosomal protein L12E/L44/L45/RPP1/RPP2
MTKMNNLDNLQELILKSSTPASSGPAGHALTGIPTKFAYDPGEDEDDEDDDEDEDDEDDDEDDAA